MLQGDKSALRNLQKIKIYSHKQIF